MDTLIAFLRGVNVSGQKPVKMKELTGWLSDAGLEDVKHYIQSGNLVFKTGLSDKSRVAQLIHDTILKKLAFEVPVLLMNPEELEQKVNAHPALSLPSAESSNIYYTFLFDEPAEDQWDKLSACQFEGEQHYRAPGLVYFYPTNGYGKAKMNNNFFETRLKVAATTRNLNTCRKMLELAAG